MKQLPLIPDTPTQPIACSKEPKLWIKRLIILRTPSLRDDHVIRDIRLRRGLNIVWAQPQKFNEPLRSDEGRIAGHTAGKTTLCRMIRYLLGEERLGMLSTRERLRTKIPHGWVVAEIVVLGTTWIVARPFADDMRGFAARNVSVEEAFTTRGEYQDFIEELNRCTISDLPAKNLPYSRQPVEWLHILAWASRDQEARFGGIVDWRHHASGSGSPVLRVGDRHAVLRTMLGLMSDRYGELQQEQDELRRQSKHMGAKANLLRRRANDDQRRLAARLGMNPDESELGPLFASQLRQPVEARRTALEQQEAAIKKLEIHVESAQEEMSRARERRAVLKDRLDRAEGNRRMQHALAEGLQSAHMDAELEAKYSPPQAAPGRCNALLSEAQEKKCPLANEATTNLASRRLERHSESDVGAQRRELQRLEAQEATARQAYESADATHRELNQNYIRINTALKAERARLSNLLTEMAALDSMLAQYNASEEATRTMESERRKLMASTRILISKKRSIRIEQAHAKERLSDGFNDVVKALLGSEVTGNIKINMDEVEARISAQGERDGAAIEILKVIAFDLTALTLSVGGDVHFPGFLIHDSPREADIDQNIYERLFIYAQKLERRFQGKPGFQYIVTTTAPPPVELRQAPWVLDLQLDASVAAGRLLKIDL